MRGLPAQILDMAGSTRRLDHTLSYDQNGNLTGIVDGLDGMETRSLGYDARILIQVGTAFWFKSVRQSDSSRYGYPQGFRWGY